jgi:hypothetical protein
LVTTGSALNRLAVGTNDYSLLADSTATNGVSWKQLPAASIATDAITTAKILDSNVTAAKIAADAVTTAKILDANVTAAKLATDSVITAKIQDSAVTQAKMADRAIGSAELDGLTLNPVVDTYTLALADAHKLVTLNKSTGFTVTIPPNSSVQFDLGDQVNLMQIGDGQITVAAGSGVTLEAQGSKKKLNGKWATATAIKIATDTWVLVGNTAV